MIDQNAIINRFLNLIHLCYKFTSDHVVHGRHRAGLPPMEEPGEKETQQPLDHRDWFGFAKSRFISIYNSLSYVSFRFEIMQCLLYMFFGAFLLQSCFRGQPFSRSSGEAEDRWDLVGG